MKFDWLNFNVARRLLREMGWDEGATDVSEITEEERREFERQLQQVIKIFFDLGNFFYLVGAKQLNMRIVFNKVKTR
jgi:hypothetical protein